MAGVLTPKITLQAAKPPSGHFSEVGSSNVFTDKVESVGVDNLGGTLVMFGVDIGRC